MSKAMLFASGAAPGALTRYMNFVIARARRQ